MVKKVENAARFLMKDKCSIYIKRPVEKDSLTRFETELKYENVPCTISSKAYLFGESAASENDNLAEVKKSVKLFLPPEYEVEAGSMVEVKRLGKSEWYKRSGQMKRYLSHNEVMLELMKNWA